MQYAAWPKLYGIHMLAIFAKRLTETLISLVFPQDVNETAYKRLVRPILEYGSFVFGIHKVLK